MTQTKEKTDASDLVIARDGILDGSLKGKISRDVVIVGAGISGLYSAMKLLEKPQEMKDRSIKTITILEKSDRLGGRLDTDIIEIKTEDGGDYVIKEEEGAMRFTYNEDPQKSNMPHLARLIQKLGIESKMVPFYMKPQPRPPATNSKTTVPDCNANVFRGQYFTNWFVEQNPSLWKSMYDLEGPDKVEKGKSAGDINKDIYKKLLHHNASKVKSHYPPKKAEAILANDLKDPLLQEYLNPEYWSFFRNKFTWPVGEDQEETVLNNFTMLGLMTAMGYSHGCRVMMQETVGFEQDVLTKVNVGCALQDEITFDLIGDRLFQFKEGFSYLIKKLLKHLRKLERSCEVTLDIQKNSDVVEFVDPKEGFKLKLKTGDVYEARYVVMAVAPTALEKILRNTCLWSMLLDNKLMNICDASVGQRLTKINQYYENDWWNQIEGTCMFGPSTTDMPCGFLYPFYSECKASGCLGCVICDKYPCPAALTIYCDENQSQFWSSLQRLGPLFQSKLQKDHRKLQPAAKEVVKEARKQFAKILNIDITKIPEPVLTSYRSWDGQDGKTNGNDPQKTDNQFAVHMWGIGVDDEVIREQVAQPVKGKNLFLCNEAWSGYQAWVEGSLESTEEAMEALFATEQDDQPEA